MNEQVPSTVLLVEDSPTQMAFFRSLLERAGFLVRVAKNGAEALMTLGEEMAEIIISDCDMPLLDGFQLCRLLKDHPATRHIPFLLLTGSPSRLSRFWARTCGADQFLLKDGTEDRLLTAVQALVEKAQARQAEVDSGIWDIGLKRISPLRVEDIAVQLSMALEHRLLEITVRNSVASLQERITDPPQVAWGFLNLLRDLVSPGAIYLLCPEGPQGYACYLMSSPSAPEASLDDLLASARDLPALAGKGLEIRKRVMDWEPNKPVGLIQKHFPMKALAGGAEGQWGLLIERNTYQMHRTLFKEASSELNTLFQVMSALRLLAEANHRLKQADEAKTDFVLTLSHDMRSPLGAVQVALDALKTRGEELSEKGRNWVDVGSRSVDRLIRMINGVLDLEKIEAGSFTFQPVLVDVAVLTMESLRAMEPLAASRHIWILQVPEFQEGFWIRIDPDRFQQIMVNLLSNAIKFSPSPGEIRIELSRADGYVRVAVRDQGPGIPEAFKERVFGKFQQAERKASGTGLGLAITRHLVEHMGGSIGFESEEGLGASFWVRFPEAEERRV